MTVKENMVTYEGEAWAMQETGCVIRIFILKTCLFGIIKEKNPSIMEA
ncbi:hypothetical protein [Paenibacillus sp. GCM10027629]